jgi:PKD repeat protein
MRSGPFLAAMLLLSPLLFLVVPGGDLTGLPTPSSLVLDSKPPISCDTPTPTDLQPSATPVVQAGVALNPSDAGIDLNFCSTITGVTGPYKLNWSFGDGTNSSVQDPVHVYLVPANYTVVLTLNSTDFNTSVAIYALVNASVAATAGFAPSAPTTATSINFTDSARLGTPPYAAFWSFGDNMTATGNTVLHMYHRAGTYTVQVWTNDTGGGSAYQLFAVKVTAAPSNSQPTGSIDILIGTSIAAVAVAVAGFGYLQWDKKRRPKRPTLTPPPPPTP